MYIYTYINIHIHSHLNPGKPSGSLEILIERAEEGLENLRYREREEKKKRAMGRERGGEVISGSGLEGKRAREQEGESARARARQSARGSTRERAGERDHVCPV